MTGFRQGTVVAWDPITASNVVDVGDSVLTDVPTLTTKLATGDAVALMTTGRDAQSRWILGRISPSAVEQ